MKDLESALIVPKTILFFAGRWPENSRTIFSRLREIVFFIVEVIFKVFVMFEVYIVCMDFHFETLFEIMAVIIVSVGHLFKMIFFKWNNNVWLELLDQLKTKHFNNYPKEFTSINDKHVNFAKNFGNFFQFGCCCSSTAYIVAPFFSDIDLPVRCSFVSRKYIPYMYLFQSFVIALCAMTHSSIDVVITDLIGISVGQLNVLIEKIKAFGADRTKQKIDIRDCIEHHIEIIRFIDNLKRAVSGILMVEYAKSALVICFLGIQAVHSNPTSAPFIRISVYGLVMLLQLVIYCFFANEILVKGLEIGDACYHSLWFDAEQKYKNSLILIMERSKRPLYLTAGKISIVCLKSFTSILKSSYSYFALMQSLYARDEV